MGVTQVWPFFELNVGTEPPIMMSDASIIVFIEWRWILNGSEHARQQKMMMHIFKFKESLEALGRDSFGLVVDTAVLDSDTPGKDELYVRARSDHSTRFS